MGSFIERLHQIEQERQEQQRKVGEEAKQTARELEEKLEFTKEMLPLLQEKCQQIFKDSEVEQKLREFERFIGKNQRVETFSEKGFTRYPKYLYEYPKLVYAGDYFSYSKVVGARWDFRPSRYKYALLGIQAVASANLEQIKKAHASAQKLKIEEELKFGLVEPDGELHPLTVDLKEFKGGIEIPFLPLFKGSIKEILQNEEWKNITKVEQIILDYFVSPLYVEVEIDDRESLTHDYF